MDSEPWQPRPSQSTLPADPGVRGVFISTANELCQSIQTSPSTSQADGLPLPPSHPRPTFRVHSQPLLARWAQGAGMKSAFQPLLVGVGGLTLPNVGY